MNDYTMHVQVPDIAIGAVLQDLVLDPDLVGVGVVTCATVRSGQGTWLSVGVAADSDDDAIFRITSLRYNVANTPDVGVIMPSGYDLASISVFETAPMLVTSGRTAIYSEGI